jgi:TrmH family RNA methyltransferase
MISVIFVEPESSGNIGSIARCMENFGAHQLILVNPCPLEGAQKMAMHAAHILDDAIITDRFQDALQYVDISLATTSKTSGFKRKAHLPSHLPSFPGSVRIGIVIGRESSGLTNEEIEQCDVLVSIPTCDTYPTLNAATACCILLYELATSEKNEKQPKELYRNKIMDEFEKITAIIEKRPHRKKIWTIVMKRLIYTAYFTERESTVLLGFFRRVRNVLESTPSQKN